MSVNSAQTSSSSQPSLSSLQSSSVDLISSSSVPSPLTRTIAFCENCREIVTDTCVSAGKHRNHKLSDLHEAAIEQSDTYESVKENITALYNELWDLLQQNHQQALRLLDAEKDTLHKSLIQLDVDGDNHQERLMDIQGKIEQVEMQTADPEKLLGEIKGQLESLEVMEKFYSTMKEQVISDNNVERKVKFNDMRLRALEDSVRKIVQKNKELLPQPWDFSVAITFDERKKHKDLRIFEDETILLRGTSARQMNKRAALWSSVMAVQSFSEGQHYWEVEVGGCRSWSVGVVEQGWEKNNLDHPLGRDKASWALESDEGDLTALHNDDLSGIRGHSTHRLGVYVDCDKSKVKFYDANSGQLLHVFFTKFRSAVYPAFSIKNNDCRNTSKLIICKLFPKSKNTYLEDSDFGNAS
ncbi:hypothetical protein NFI96_000307 [Prochilodus magdalenae]|nr:hypothetical protein NFI96_000307 [Prochilodus magdalenae]